jgi:uncharacterized protein (TIGR02145 family)
VETTVVTGITSTSALSGGSVTSGGNAEVTKRGVCWNTFDAPTISNNSTSDGKGEGSFNSSITGLTANTKYFVRAYAINSEGPAYGNQFSFTTDKVGITITTYDPNNSITSTMASSGGYIINIGEGLVTARGVCWGTEEYPTITDSHTNDGTGNGSFNSNITGLLANTTYYVRAYATNNEGTDYGNQISFVTMAEIGPIIFNPNLTYITISDIDGNIYKTIQIGTQIWMAENLKTTRFNDGTQIPLVNDKPWEGLMTAAYIWYRNDATTYKAAYGAIYNWYAINAANNGTKNVCPTGWHVPSDLDWKALTSYLGGDSVAGNKLKEIGSSHWRFDIAATNESGFTALPGGYLGTGFMGGSSFSAITEEGSWWSSTENSTYTAWIVDISCNTKNVFRWEGDKQYGLSVRCIKDN